MTTATATPGPAVDIIAYPNRNCAVNAVARNGNTPNFQLVQLVYDATSKSSNCVKTGSNPLSFSWDIVSFGSVASSCNLYFYKGDSCFNDNGGSTQLSLLNGQDECQNLSGVGSVRLFC